MSYNFDILYELFQVIMRVYWLAVFQKAVNSTKHKFVSRWTKNLCTLAPIDYQSSNWREINQSSPIPLSSSHVCFATGSGKKKCMRIFLLFSFFHSQQLLEAHID